MVTRNNYETMRALAAQQFAQSDHDAAVGRFGLQRDERFIYLSFLADDYRICVADGCVQVRLDDAWQTAGVDEAMTIYDLLTYAKPQAKPAKSFASIDSLNKALISSAPKNAQAYANQAQHLDEHPEHIAAAMGAIGARMVDGGDIAAQIELFAGLDAQLRFWASDDEFAAQLQVLFDENTLAFMHFETAWYAANALVKKLMNAFESEIG